MTNTEKLNCLTDRPCTVCKYHKENGCSKWSCVFEQEPTTKNDLEVDCISRADAIRVASGYCHPSNVAKELAKLPSMGRYDPYTDKFIKE